MEVYILRQLIVGPSKFQNNIFPWNFNLGAWIILRTLSWTVGRMDTITWNRWYSALSINEKMKYLFYVCLMSKWCKVNNIDGYCILIIWRFYLNFLKKIVHAKWCGHFISLTLSIKDKLISNDLHSHRIYCCS